MSGGIWKVGELAQLTGLTVRTLHHYEHIGLVAPSGRTSAGHRLYDDHDLRRLYRVVALRDLGLPLESIRTLLEGELDLAQLLRDQSDHVQRRISALRALHTRLAVLVERADGAGDIASPDLLALIEEVSRMEKTFRNYFSDDQVERLEQRREQRGQQVVDAEIAEWPQLIARVQAEMDAGTEPSDPKVAPLARRWMELLEAFHGGDEGLRDSLYRMQHENSETVQEQGGPPPEMIEYIRRANAAG
ncbi:DNA-binding transcriptional MerR regulator [Lipingzhangella halophila]|uniref:DNA-binding transcriptional MerR regulator n=1 Tax=Lipingzhangella halophila TaxID=1783352 RepID=A0A7W7RCD2_9ACTN|nr:MerR family transcriptional regulator [Lipingzhangella halophila]MBB4929319.1 DNA-binding transcriptional MerR regulator [Lipingzhangella halophila]